ncbi:MAG: hypothetical protein M3Y87_26355 [Myxococcota bacterium]|nr:hypothetical protein [Myxococcota bacterium]
MRRGLVMGLALASIGLLACGGDPPVEPEPDPSCSVADVSCPSEAPFAGAPCEGELRCPYSTTTGEGTFTCVGGRWDGSILCAGCAPPLAESCASPFAGSAPGSVELGAPGGAFAAFADGERAPVEWGGQGFAMIGYRVRAGGDAPPSCVRLTSRVRIDGGEWVQGTRPVALRCGQSLQVLDILPELPCEFRDYSVDVEVDVEGVGSGAAHLIVEGGGCPRALPG